MVYVKKLDNGIRLVVKQMEGLMSVSMGVLVGTGAYVESDAEDGISHFIEHMMFKGTQKRTAFAISDEMDRIGAQTNAFTGKDITCYYAKSTTENAAAAFEILADLFLNSAFPEEEMAREKNVIIEEISMNEDTPDDLCLDLLSEAYYGREGYGRNILGTRENVLGFTRADVDRYMKARYTSDNIVISMAGNISVQLAEELAEKYFGGLPATHADKRVIGVSARHRSLVKHKDIEQVHIALAWPSVTRDDRLYDAVRIMNSVLGGSMSSRLFQEVREKLGLAYTVYSYNSAYADTGTLVVYAGVNAKNYLRSVDAVKKCIDDVKGGKIGREECERGREQLKASSIFAQESTSSQMLLYGKEMLYSGKPYSFEERIAAINAVTADDLAEAIEGSFNNDGMAASLVGKLDKPLVI